jgi:hypothetical protein
LGNNATSEEASDELAPASVRGRLAKAPTPPRRPSGLSFARGAKVDAERSRVKTSSDKETPESSVRRETKEMRRDSKAAPKAEKQNAAANEATRGKELLQKNPSAKGQITLPSRNIERNATARPTTVAPLGGLRAAAKGAASEPKQ